MHRSSKGSDRERILTFVGDAHVQIGRLTDNRIVGKSAMNTERTGPEHAVFFICDPSNHQSATQRLARVV